MLTHKKVNERGKLSLVHYFQKLNEGDKVALVMNLSYPANFPKRMQGKTGTVVGKRGNSYVVKLMDGKKEKTFILSKIHIKKLK